ncbi:MAG: pilin [Minisyncoccota bacterium]
MEPPTALGDIQAETLLYLNQKDSATCVSKGGVWDNSKCNAPQITPATCAESKELPCKTNADCSWNTATNKCDGEATLYTTLTVLYSEGTDFVKNLLPSTQTNQYKVIVDIPCDNTITKLIGGASCTKTQNYTNSIPLYIARLYQFGFGIVGVVALLMIIIGAAKYTLSAGSFASKDEAKEQITEAIYGILLLFGAYLVLYTINPGLVSIQAPTLTTISVDNLSTQATVQTPTNTNTPIENITANPLTNCVVASVPPEKAGCKKCADGFGLNTTTGSCVAATINASCSSSYSFNGTCLPCPDTQKESNGKCIAK